MNIEFMERAASILPEDNKQIFASQYETILPSKEKLQELLNEHLSEDSEE